MTRQKLQLTGKFVALVAVIALSASMGHAADEKEVYTAFAVNMRGTGPGGATTFQTMDRWSTRKSGPCFEDAPGEGP